MILMVGRQGVGPAFAIDQKDVEAPVVEHDERCISALDRNAAHRHTLLQSDIACGEGMADMCSIIKSVKMLFAFLFQNLLLFWEKWI